MPSLPGVTRGAGLKAPGAGKDGLTPEQKLLLLDTWKRSGLPAGDFSGMVGVSRNTLNMWKRRFDAHGPEGLLDLPRKQLKRTGISEVTRRTILMIKENNPEYGCQRISDMLVRGPGLAASPNTVAKVLRDGGYELVEEATKPHEPKVNRFERAAVNELWQTDLFTFILKRQNRRVYLVVFMDDHSRFIVGYGLNATSGKAQVIEVLKAAIASYQVPREVLTDNGPQYITWRGKSEFTKTCESLGIKQIVSTPKHPETLGKVERFWGTLWRECVERAIFIDLGDARKRIGLFIDHYNFQRPHQGLDGAVPADVFFRAAEAVKATLKERVAANSLELAKNGLPTVPFYLTGTVGGKAVSIHAEGERVIVTGDGVERREVHLEAPASAPVCPAGIVNGSREDDHEAERAPGTSPLDEGLKKLVETLPNQYNNQTKEQSHGN
jgi:transposase InsO family protein